MKKTLRVINSFIGVVGLLILWELISLLYPNPAIPSLLNIINELISILTDVNTYNHIISSLKIVLIGICTAILFGLSLGTIMTRYRHIYTALIPVIEALRGVAALTLFPMLIAIAGIGDGSRVFVIFWTAWPSILISTMHGLETDKTIVEAAASSGANENQIMWYIRLPLAIPNIVSGIRIGISGGWISLIAAEMLGATKGIGYMLLWNSQAFNFKAVYAYIIIIAVLGGFMNYLMLKIENKLKEKYQ